MKIALRFDFQLVFLHHYAYGVFQINLARVFNALGLERFKQFILFQMIVPFRRFRDTTPEVKQIGR